VPGIGIARWNWSSAVAVSSALCCGFPPWRRSAFTWQRGEVRAIVSGTVLLSCSIAPSMTVTVKS